MVVVQVGELDGQEPLWDREANIFNDLRPTLGR